MASLKSSEAFYDAMLAAPAAEALFAQFAQWVRKPSWFARGDKDHATILMQAVECLAHPPAPPGHEQVARSQRSAQETILAGLAAQAPDEMAIPLITARYLEKYAIDPALAEFIRGACALRRVPLSSTDQREILTARCSALLGEHWGEWYAQGRDRMALDYLRRSTDSTACFIEAQALGALLAHTAYPGATAALSRMEALFHEGRTIENNRRIEGRRRGNRAEREARDRRFVSEAINAHIATVEAAVQRGEDPQHAESPYLRTLAEQLHLPADNSIPAYIGRLRHHGTAAIPVEASHASPVAVQGEGIVALNCEETRAEVEAERRNAALLSEVRKYCGSFSTHRHSGLKRVTKLASSLPPNTLDPDGKLSNDAYISHAIIAAARRDVQDLMQRNTYLDLGKLREFIASAGPEAPRLDPTGHRENGAFIAECLIKKSRQLIAQLGEYSPHLMQDYGEHAAYLWHEAGQFHPFPPPLDPQGKLDDKTYAEKALVAAANRLLDGFTQGKEGFTWERVRENILYALTGGDNNSPDLNRTLLDPECGLTDGQCMAIALTDTVRKKLCDANAVERGALNTYLQEALQLDPTAEHEVKELYKRLGEVNVHTLTKNSKRAGLE